MKKKLKQMKAIAKTKRTRVDEGQTIQWRTWSGVYTVPVLAAYKLKDKMLIVLAMMSLQAAYTVEDKNGKLGWVGYVGQNGAKQNVLKTAEKLDLDKVVPLLRETVWSAL